MTPKCTKMTFSPLYIYCWFLKWTDLRAKGFCLIAFYTASFDVGIQRMQCKRLQGKNPWPKNPSIRGTHNKRGAWWYTIPLASQLIRQQVGGFSFDVRLQMMRCKRLQGKNLWPEDSSIRGTHNKRARAW